MTLLNKIIMTIDTDAVFRRRTVGRVYDDISKYNYNYITDSFWKIKDK